jgi:hypothetical protein
MYILKGFSKKAAGSAAAYSAATTPPPWSSKVWWSGRWDQQHDGVVLMVESICRQGFAYAHNVEEDWAKHLVKLGLEKDYRRDNRQCGN